MTINLENATESEEDAKLVMRWRNDDFTRQVSFHDDIKKWPGFWKEYCSKYFNQDLPSLFAVYDNQKVGILKFSEYEENLFPGRTIDIGINLAPEYRGLGLGTKILRLANERMFNQGIENIMAEIKPVNTPSISSFSKAGYIYFDRVEKRVEDLGIVVPILRYVARKER